ncbi:mandelate racemase/muconate lactonizing enzyme family protein [Subtercola frigoramans]|uniref:L-alanine-DL-glutamate epimerase-like enolase superfamily enzyme n=1 Tax=Subtercola frigoramans TaxID=120298 RepID=A0ABS2L177_9MICO|nr:enolase C-terminal domain-like protein [Subtercola frigoramans]MBM7470833.1 L-alanine-DL-glutamate epimerase-like enolase superfamily enzyme [Subtercola frigoramans]
MSITSPSFADEALDPSAHRPASVESKIVAVRAIPYAIPYSKPLHFASGSIDVADNVLVEVETEDGIVGFAEAPPRPYTYGETQESIVAAIDRLFAPAVVGLALSDREKVRVRLERTVGNPTAKSAIDMAMWDAIGKTFNTPVHKLLGGHADGLRVSHMLGFDPPASVAEQALVLRDELGVTSFKIKVGRRPIRLDVAVCQAVRDALGPEAEIYIDGNRGWSAAESAEALRMLADVGLSRVEELCPADDILSRRWLVAQCTVPFVADESVATPANVTREILSGAATAISIKTARTGFSDSLRVSHLAEGLGVEVVIGNQIDGHIGTICSLAFGASQASTSRHAAELSNYLDMADHLLTEPLRIADGEMRVLPGAGLGIEIDPEKLARYRTDN